MGEAARLRAIIDEAKAERARHGKAKKKLPPASGKGKKGKKGKGKRFAKTYTTLDDGSVSVRTVSAGGFETNRRRH